MEKKKTDNKNRARPTPWALFDVSVRQRVIWSPCEKGEIEMDSGENSPESQHIDLVLQVQQKIALLKAILC